VLYGIGQGFNAPGLFAWTSDLSDKEFRGRAIAFLFMALETGIIAGGLSAGFLIHTRSEPNFSAVFLVMSAFPAATLISVLLMRKAKK
jgi:MFS family permease